MFLKESAKHGKAISQKNGIIAQINGGGDYLINPLIYSQMEGTTSKLQSGIYYALVYAMQEPLSRLVPLLNEVRRKRVEMENNGATKEEVQAMRDAHDWTVLKGEHTNAGIEVVGTRDKDGYAVLTIPMSNIGISNKHYELVSEALDKMAGLVYSYDENIVDGKWRRVSEPIFKRVSMEYEKYGTERRYSGLMKVEISLDIVDRIFCMKYGYVQHLSYVARIAKGMGSSLYRYLAQLNTPEYAGHGDVRYNDVKEFFGVFHYNKDRTGPGMKKDKDGNLVVDDSYPNYAHFKRDILEKTKKELDALCKEGKLDYSFQYEPLYLNGKKRGIPDFIRFHLMRAQDVIDAANGTASPVVDAEVVRDSSDALSLWDKFIKAAERLCKKEDYKVWANVLYPVSVTSEVVTFEVENQSQAEMFSSAILFPAWHEFVNIFGPTVKLSWIKKRFDNSRSGQCSVRRG